MPPKEPIQQELIELQKGNIGAASGGTRNRNSPKPTWPVVFFQFATLMVSSGLGGGMLCSLTAVGIVGVISWSMDSGDIKDLILEIFNSPTVATIGWLTSFFIFVIAVIVLKSTKKAYEERLLSLKEAYDLLAAEIQSQNAELTNSTKKGGKP